MVRVLIAASILVAVAGTAAAGGDSRHDWTIDVSVGLTSASSDFEPWTEGGLGKLRFADGTALGLTRLFVDYRGRITPTLGARLTADYVEDASPGVDVTEAYLEWRPVPDSPLRHQWRLGAFYPPFSLENGDSGWGSPFMPSFSAINTWLGEEVRPLGIEWSGRRPLGPPGSPQELGAFAGAFYGNDPAGTLLFWRGFAIHDRQSRLGDELPLAPAPIYVDGAITAFRPQTLEPFHETDHRPGYYAGLEWRYTRRVMLRAGRYDNRADPESFSGGQWGWDTSFWQVAGQVELPWDIGVVAQWMRGETWWLQATLPTGEWTPATELVKDEFDAAFVLVTKRIGEVHRLTVRVDDFGYSRAPDMDFDEGYAWAVAYRYAPPGRVGAALEWLTIDSERDLWRDFYGAPYRMRERQLRLELTVRL